MATPLFFAAPNADLNLHNLVEQHVPHVGRMRLSQRRVSTLAGCACGVHRSPWRTTRGWGPSVGRALV